MIFVDTKSNKIMFDIGPGDIGTGQKLFLEFRIGLNVSREVTLQAAHNIESTSISQIANKIIKYLTVFNQKGQTA